MTIYTILTKKYLKNFKNKKRAIFLNFIYKNIEIFFVIREKNRFIN